MRWQISRPKTRKRENEPVTHIPRCNFGAARMVLRLAGGHDEECATRSAWLSPNCPFVLRRPSPIDLFNWQSDGGKPCEIAQSGTHNAALLGRKLTLHLTDGTVDRADDAVCSLLLMDAKGAGWRYRFRNYPGQSTFLAGSRT
jgi:hypothetical protein